MKGLCTYCGEKPISAKGLCHNCYVRYRRNGTPKPLGTRRVGHPKADEKIKAWMEQGKSYTKAAEVLGCSKQAIYDAVSKHYKYTNGDRIRSLTDEELAKIIPRRLDCSECPARIGDYRACVENCKERWLAWLKQEAKDD